MNSYKTETNIRLRYSGKSISTLLGIIERFETNKKRVINFPEPLGKNNELNVLKLASLMLSRWPNGLYDLLEGLLFENKSTKDENASKIYTSFYNSFFKSGLPLNEVVFIRKAFSSVGHKFEINNFIDSLIKKYPEKRGKLLSVDGLADYLKVNPCTVQNYVSQRIIKAQHYRRMGRYITLFDMEDIPFKPHEGTFYKQREAAKFIHLSVGILKTLKEKKIYIIKRLSWGLEGYSELDLIEFRETLLSKAPDLLEAVSNDHISLAKLFRKNNHLAISVNALDGILLGALVPDGRIGNEIPDIVLSKFKLECFIRKNARYRKQYLGLS